MSQQSIEEPSLTAKVVSTLLIISGVLGFLMLVAEVLK